MIRYLLNLLLSATDLAIIMQRELLPDLRLDWFLLYKYMEWSLELLFSPKYRPATCTQTFIIMIIIIIIIIIFIICFNRFLP